MSKAGKKAVYTNSSKKHSQTKNGSDKTDKPKATVKQGKKNGGTCCKTFIFLFVTLAVVGVAVIYTNDEIREKTVQYVTFMKRNAMERYEQEIKPVVMKRWEEMFGTEESKQDAQKQKGNLEKLKKQDEENKRLEEEKKRKDAEIKKQEDEKKRLEYEKKQVEAEKKKQEEVEKKQLEDEKKKQEEVEKKQVEAEKKKQEEVEKKQLEDEKKRLEAEKKKQEEVEKRQLEDEKKRLDAEKKKQEEVEKRRLEDEKKTLEAEKKKQEEVEKRQLEDEKKRLDAEKKKQEEVEKKRLEDEKKRLEAEKKKQEEVEKRRLEDEKKRLEAEKKKQEEVEKKRLEDEKKRLEAEKKKQEEVEKKRLEDEKKRLEAEKKKQEEVEKRRLEDEKKRLEAEKKKQEEIEKKQLEDEKKRLEVEKKKQEEVEKKRLEGEKKRLEAEKKKQEEVEKKRLEDEKKRLEAEKKKQEEVEKKRLEDEKKKQEEVEKRRLEDEKKRLEAEKKKQEEVEKKRLEDEKKKQEEVEKKRLEDEKKRLEAEKKKQEEVEKKRLEDEKKKQEEVEKKRLEDEKKRQEQQKKLEDEKRKQKEMRKLQEENKRLEEEKKIKEQQEEKRMEEERKKAAKDEKRKQEEDRKKNEEKIQAKINKDYDKKSITSEADYDIREELDEAESNLYMTSHAVVLDMFEKILKKYPKSPRANFMKAEILEKMAAEQKSNDFLEQAITQYQSVLDLLDVPKDLLIKAGTTLADKQAFRGWNSKASKTWRFLSDKFPNDVELKNKLGVSFLMSMQNEEARKIFKQVLEMDPANGYAKVHLGFIFKVIDNNPEKSIPLLTEGIASEDEGTKDGRFYFHLGDALQRLNQTENAYKVYQAGAENGLFLSMYQRSLYNIDTLTGRPWWTIEETGYQEYFKLLQDNWKTIRDEGLAQMDVKTGGFVPEAENLREQGDWKQFTLYQRGQKDKENCAKVPKTCELIDKIIPARTCSRGQIKYSVIHPGAHIWPHCGPTNCRIRSHLGLKIPPGLKIRVAQQTRTWEEGKFIIFDDSFEHEVWHDGNEFRLVLIVDFWHPELTEQQKKTISPI